MPKVDKKQVHDALQQLAEEKAAALGVERADPAKLRIDNEIASAFDPVTNEVEVSNARPGKVYCWVNCSLSAAGRFIRLKQADGWAVVQGTDPEAKEHQGIAADTTRKIGDVLLMWISQERYDVILARQAAFRRARDGGVASALYELADKYRGHGVIVREMTEPEMKRAGAQQLAARHFDTALRRGTVPGMPASTRR